MSYINLISIELIEIVLSYSDTLTTDKFIKNNIMINIDLIN